MRDGRVDRDGDDGGDESKAAPDQGGEADDEAGRRDGDGGVDGWAR